MGICLGHLQTDFSGMHEYSVINNYVERYKKNYEFLEYGFKTMVKNYGLMFVSYDGLTNLYDLLEIFNIKEVLKEYGNIRIYYKENCIITRGIYYNFNEFKNIKNVNIICFDIIYHILNIMETECRIFNNNTWICQRFSDFIDKSKNILLSINLIKNFKSWSDEIECHIFFKTVFTRTLQQNIFNEKSYSYHIVVTPEIIVIDNTNGQKLPVANLILTN